MKYRVINEYWNTTEVFHVQVKKWYGWTYRRGDLGFRVIYESLEEAQKAIKLMIPEKSKKKIVYEC